MLTSLSIRDVVLIEKLELELGRGLNALTGETGAGKSILLDALGLALGERSEAGLVRAGQTQAGVTAIFDLSDNSGADHAVTALLQEHDLSQEDTLILRRVVAADGKSRAFINDQPVGVGLLRDVARRLVETHGQFELSGLTDRETHRATLDSFGRLEKFMAATRAAWEKWRAAKEALANAEQNRDRAVAEEAFLREALLDLDELNPEIDEAAALEEKRTRLANRDKIREGLSGALTELSGTKSAESALNAARRHLDRIADSLGAATLPAQKALTGAAAELAEAIAELESLANAEDDEPGALGKLDDRLFALRARGRRHGVEPNALTGFRDELRERLSLIEGGSDALSTLARAANEARTVYLKAAEVLSAKRRDAASKFDKAIARELPPLKLEKARVETEIRTVEEGDAGPLGMDRVTFLIATNPGAIPGPLAKIASGGELARFMLAMKVVLAGKSEVPVMVFDEVDSGIGGATADAVGERLSRLGQDVQVLVVTHSPQVAARAAQHWRVEKRAKKNAVVTEIVKLDAAARQEEIARMLSGAEVTAEARAAAAKLLDVA